jgi:hypothetical protein
VQEVNQFWESYRGGPLVLCSRQDEYERLPVRLRLGGAVIVSPLELQQIATYLAAAGPRWDAVRAQLLAGSNPFLQELFTTPLMLSVAVLGYKDQNPADLGETRDGGAQHNHLWSQYVFAVMSRGDDGRASSRGSYSKQQVTRWLGWLANAMRSKHETELWLHEWTGPPSLSRKIRIGAGAILGLGLGLVLSLESGISFAAITCLLMCLAGGFMGAVVFKTQPALRLPFTFRRLASSSMRGGVGGLGVGLAFGAATVPVSFLIYPLFFALCVGLVFAATTKAALKPRTEARAALNRRQLVERLAAGMAFTLILAGGLAVETARRLTSLCLGGLLFGFSVAGIVKRAAARVDESNSYRRTSPFSRVVVGLGLGIGVGLLGQLVVRALARTFLGLQYGPEVTRVPGFGRVRIEAGIPLGSHLLIALTFALVGALLAIVGAVVSFGPDRERIAPNSTTQLITDSSWIGLSFGLTGGVLAGITLGLSFGLRDGLLLGPLVGLGVGLSFGLDCTILHLAFRLWLRRQGGGPFRWVMFLQWASDHLLLRTMGGSYTWIHLELRDYLAEEHSSSDEQDAVPTSSDGFG